MAYLNEMTERAKRLSQNARGVVVGIIEDHEEFITGYNKEQLISGFDRNGERFKPYGGLLYALEKNKQNPKAGYGNPDLNLTGAFYRGFFISVTGTTFEISSNDSKNDELLSKYGSSVFGLSNASLASYSKNEFFDEFKKFIENTLKITMT